MSRVGRNIDEDDGHGLCGPAVNRDGWIRLGTASQTFFRRSPTLHYMYDRLSLCILKTGLSVADE